ncbi:MAG TPA: TIGR01841 family phasin [Burkholderiaceae bacterium]|nr:TIGR01841 family phasin [Burkholderiaceae bacterium]
MYASPNQIFEMQKSQLEAFQAVGSSVLLAAEKLAQLNLATTRALMQEGAGAAQNFIGAKDPQEAATVAGAFAQPAPEKMVNYSRSAYGIASEAGVELAKIFEAQLAQGNRKLAEFVDFAAKGAPVGSEPAINLLKNSIAAANSAFDAVAKAARQATETAESNIAAAVAVASDAVKSKAKKSAS